MVNDHRIEFVCVPSLDGRVVRTADKVLGEERMLVLSVTRDVAHRVVILVPIYLFIC